jgi:hypothetical protein
MIGVILYYKNKYFFESWYILIILTFESSFDEFGLYIPITFHVSSFSSVHQRYQDRPMDQTKYEYLILAVTSLLK